MANIPTLPLATGNNCLVVCLLRLSKEAKQRLEDAIANALEPIQIDDAIACSLERNESQLKTKAEFVPCHDNAAQAKLEKERKDGESNWTFDEAARLYRCLTSWRPSCLDCRI